MENHSGFLPLVGVSMFRIIHHIGIFHACYGSEVIRNTKLNDKFKYWVSYNNVVPFVVGITEIDEIWKEIFERIVELLKNSNNSEALKDGILATYYTYKSDLQNRRAFIGSELLISHLQMLISRIESKNI